MTERKCSNKKSKISWWSIIVWGIGCVAIIAGAIVLVCVCRAKFTPPKDTEVGIPAMVAYLTFTAIIIQVVINRMQWKAMQRALNQTDDIIEQNKSLFEAANRPSLGFHTLRLRREVGKRLEVQIELKNSGNSPARNVFALSQLTLWQNNNVPATGCPSPILSCETDGMISKSIVPVNGSKWQTAYVDNSHLTQKELDDINNGNIIPILWINATYEGLSGNEFFVTYYGKWVFTSEAFGECPNPEFNEAS